jgi:hypothetical protein
MSGGEEHNCLRVGAGLVCRTCHSAAPSIAVAAPLFSTVMHVQFLLVHLVGCCGHSLLPLFICLPSKCTHKLQQLDNHQNTVGIICTLLQPDDPGLPALFGKQS